MAPNSDATINLAHQFLNAVKAAHITIEKALLFGSHVHGSADKWSDIDIALVSPDFCGIPFMDAKRLAPFVLQVDSRIELHPFRPEDFTEDNEFIKEILATGVPVQ